MSFRITKNKNQVRLLFDYINNNKEFVSLIQNTMKDKDEKRKRTIDGYKKYLKILENIQKYVE